MADVGLDDHGNRRDDCGWCVLAPTTTGWVRVTQTRCPQHGPPRAQARAEGVEWGVRFADGFAAARHCHDCAAESVGPGRVLVCRGPWEEPPPAAVP